MEMRTIASGALLALFTLVVPAIGQDAAQPARPRYVSIIGTVEKMDASGKSLGLKTDKGEEPTIKFDDKTQFVRMPAGETDTRKGTRAAAADVGPGDRVIARMKPEDLTGAPAVFLYFTKQTDLAQRQKKTLEEWQTQGVAGSVKAIDPTAKQIVISVRGGFGPPKDVTLDVSGPAEYQRYSLETGKYEPSVLASVQAGDQVRVLGQKNADQTGIKVEAIMSGAFKTVPVQIKAIDTAAGTISGVDLGSKKPITVSIKADTTLKKLDDATALLMARRLNPSFQGGDGRGAGRGQGRAAEAGGQAPDAGASGRAGGGRGGRGGDPTRLLEQQPTIALADLKAGEPVVVTGAVSPDLSRLTAMTLVAGVDPILRAAPQNGPDPLGGNWNFGEIGGGPE
jgi:hypothetical protein